MKIAIYILLLTSLLSCKNDPIECIDILKGSYHGTCTSTHDEFKGNVVIKEYEGTFGYTLVEIHDETFYKDTYFGKLSGNCSGININSGYSDSLGDSLSITGFLFLEGDSLSGNVHFYDNGAVKDCSYALMKRF